MKSLVRLHILLLLVFFVVLTSGTEARQKPPTPSEFLKFEVGADRQLADYRQIVSYLRELAKGSGRIEIESMGETTLRNEFVLAAISSEENMKNKKKYQEIARKLADPRGLSQSQIEELVHTGKAIVLVTCNIHSTEIGATQMAMEWAYTLVTAQDAKTKSELDNVILLLVPSLNPDGQIMETEWYRKNLGTKYEGMRMPWLYHHYVGHDDNRDWYMLTQKETIAMNRVAYFEWFPHVWLDEHQMGSNGPRIFTPPYSSPVAATIHPLIWRGVDHIGTMMAWRLEDNRKSGVIYGFSYDAYWPGGTKNTGWWKNVFGLLTEVASAKLATPIDLPSGELAGGRKGLVEYRQQTNFPNPWPGGVWRLRDIMDYERIASDALLETCSQYREEFLRGVVTMAFDAVKSGKPGEYYRISMQQDDAVRAARLAHLMRDNGAEVLYAPAKKTFFIPTAQPYAKFLSEMLGTQRYPKVRLVAGTAPLPPYDVTTWSLPLMMGVGVDKTILSAEEQKGLRPVGENDWPEGSLDKQPAQVYAVSNSANSVSTLINEVLKKKGAVAFAKEPFEAGGNTYPAGTVLIDPTSDLGSLAQKYRVQLKGLAERPKVQTYSLKEVRIGLYKPWLASMDEGWTRWVLEQYQFKYQSLDNKTVKAGNLNASFDVILVPDVDKEVIVEGKPKTNEGEMKYFQEFPSDYAGGIGKDGVKNLKEFVEKGGTIVTLASSSDLLIDEFNIPVQNTLGRARAEEFNCPGSSLRILIDRSHPVTYGMPEEASAFLDKRIAFRTALPGNELTRTVLAWYPDDAEDILQSGWILGAERLERRAAVVTFNYGKGKLVLFGFRVQHRAQTEGTFKLLFNALHWGGVTEGK